ncbi:hypothetical protein EYR40_001674 [Pleurotus pulmonarius]|nr:hypothetical protein EYR40_001674 [Pleurotus pulmonarius]
MSDYVPNASDLNALAAPAVDSEMAYPNARPQAITRCPTCKRSEMGALHHCEGTGKQLTNFGRWYQMCFADDCPHRFYWHNPETPLECIPFSVQSRFAQRASAKDAAESSPDGLSCSNQDFANIASNAAAALGAVMPHPVIFLHLKRLKMIERYGQAWKGIHDMRHTDNQRTEAVYNASTQIAHLINVVLWAQAGHGAIYFKMPSLLGRKFVVLSSGDGSKKSEFDRLMPDVSMISIFDQELRKFFAQDIHIPIPVGPHGSILLRSTSLADVDCPELSEEITSFLTGKMPPTVASVQSSSSETPTSRPTTTLKQFPIGIHTCDMLAGMINKLDVAVGDKQMVKVFEKEFPGYAFIRTSVYQHRKWFRLVREHHLDILKTHVSYGRTELGLLL